METLRIAHVVGGFEPDRGGVARFVEAVALAVAARGHSIEVLSLGPVGHNGGLPARSLSKRDFRRGALWGAIRDGRFDVVHVHSYSSFVPLKALPAQLVAGAKRVLTPHFHAVGSYPRAARRFFDITVGRATTAAADQIHVDTRAELEGLRALHAISEERFAVVPPPLSAAFAPRNGYPERAPPGDAFRVLFVGRLDPQKRVDLLIQAVARLQRQSRRSVSLTIVGRDYLGYVPEIRRIAAHEGLQNLELVGAVPDEKLLKLYDESHALALLSRYEAFGIVLLEGMSRGVPVIAARSGGMPYLIEHNTDGLLVPYGDAGAAFDAISSLESDAALWKRLSSAGREKALSYTPERSADLTLKAYATGRRSVFAKDGE